MPNVEPADQREIDLDLGFGSVVARESHARLLNRDGSFNVRREGLNFWQEFFPYHYFLTLSWPRFLGFIGAMYIVTNVLFAFAYMACGPHALT
ncbi:MAG TPA: potassium transporter, partial [Thermoanaerobaculia bacterium]